ncbi:MAG: XRE family transcriptional regulator [Candidatus Pacebacteria bacterium]|nr:XRE family transcriptional regulator [Candidatus Paceibacterota bacterium]
MIQYNKRQRKSTTAAGSLGARLRVARAQHKLTLEELSTMAGVSKAMLSQIEQDKVNPTVAVILKVAKALNVGIADLVDAPQPHSIQQVIRAGDERYTFPAEDGCRIRTLTPLSLEKSLEFYRITFEPGSSLESDPHFPGTEEFLHMAKGKLEVQSEDQCEKLSVGDSIHYRADVDHTLRNVGRGTAEAYLIVRYQNA